MARRTFFSVLKSNIKCALCKNKNCRVRYYPDRRDVQYLEGSRFVTSCEKDMEKRFKSIGKRKLP